MKDIKFVLFSYLKLKVKMLIIFIVSICIFFAVFSLYSLPLESVLYATLLVSVFLILIGIYDFIKYYKKYIHLSNIKNNIILNDFSLPKSKDLIENEYKELINTIAIDRLQIINSKDKSIVDMMEYYTIWAHQIKTPIAAMRILLQSERSDLSTDLLEQLFKIEQYVEMVLQYLRMEHMSSDLHIRKHSLDQIIKQAVRKYSKLFIRKKIKLNYNDLNRIILTDEKWLLFVIEQILSNAIKYTNIGEISIYMDSILSNTLIIEDTGIGIEEEDLPRIFEKGFTGFNGRAYKKSTGIGLFLCKAILDKLSHTIKIESEIDKGTRVMMGLDTVDLDVSD
ncbi:MAG: sensor histidine kinase [Tissierellaceae bacterium]|nr:sensor histidine kinase [Tissierellaceae bacterium]